MSLNSSISESKDTLYEFDRSFLKKKRPKNNLFISIYLFIVFVGYRLRIFGIFLKLGEKLEVIELSQKWIQRHNICVGEKIL
jgi:hypothetical protein